METLVKLPDSAAPSTISEILASLRKEHFEPRHEAKAWGDWIYLDMLQHRHQHRVQPRPQQLRHHRAWRGRGRRRTHPLASTAPSADSAGIGVDDDGEFSLD